MTSSSDTVARFASVVNWNEMDDSEDLAQSPTRQQTARVTPRPPAL